MIKKLICLLDERYINKPKGGKPGFVTYVNEKNIVVAKTEKI